MNLNFSLNEVKPASTVKYLKAYKIYNDVTLDGIEVKEGVSAKGNAWKSLNLMFSCPEGSYNHSVFYLNTDKDVERTEMNMPNGGKRQLPSTWERSRDLIAAVGFTFFPEDFAKMQKASASLQYKDAKDAFEKIADMFIKCINKNKGKIHTNMKLVGRTSNGTVYATLPNCTGIAEAKDAKRAEENNVNVGDWYTWMISPFGDNLSFTPYEEGKKKEYEGAKPTNMDSVDNTISVDTKSQGSESDIDFDSLL
jgi:hypothetical protein